MNNKVAIFGIDGGSLALIKQWQDELPVFKHIMNSGIYGEMQSTIPAMTCPAWACMFTGKNPGKLGIYDFMHLQLNSEQLPTFVNSNDYHSSALWKIANDYGKTTGLLNIPITHPPHEIDGFMVCGLGTPEMGGVEYTHPPELKEVINKLVKGYVITPSVLITLYKQEEKCIKACEEVLAKRVQVAKYLIKKYPCDLFINVFFVSDMIQHYFWRYMDKSHPKHIDSPYEGVIKDFYKYIDSAIGELIEDIDADNVVIASDHGFGACYGGLSINRWLESKGYLRYKEGYKSSNGLYKLRDFALTHLSLELVNKLAKIIPDKYVNKMRTRGESSDSVLNLYKMVDWNKTKAYAVGTAGGGIFINVKGREPNGVVEEGQEYERIRDSIIAELEQVGLRALKKENVYWGQYLSTAPDIAIELGSGKYYPITLDKKTVWIDYAASGAHVPEGLFMAYGKDIERAGEIKGLSIYDVTPTVLNLLGVPIPEDVDGKVIQGIKGSTI